MLIETIERNCDLCGSEKNKVVAVENDYPISKCCQCGFVYVSRIPKIENGKVIGEYYAGDHLEVEANRRRYDLVSDFLLNEIEKHAGIGSILDVGCGYGFFLTKARKRGWEVFGTELSEIATRYANQQQHLPHVVCSDLDPSLFDGRQFDAINLTNVLEHVPSPTRTLTLCGQMLRDGGILMIRVPNMRFSDLHLRLSPILKLFSGETFRNWGYLATPPPEHLSGFTPKTIKHLLESRRFDKVRIKPSKLSGLAGERLIFRGFDVFAKALSAVSAGRANVSPTLLAIARKGAGSEDQE